jgi:hypothetical protein
MGNHMTKMHALVAVAALSANVAALPLAAQAASRTERVTFAKGATSKIVKSSIKGYDYVDYVINARGGQLMTVRLTTNKSSNYFNIMPKGSETAYFIGSRDGNDFRGPVPQTGDQAIRVYLMRNDARRGVTANYTLNIAVVD